MSDRSMDAPCNTAVGAYQKAFTLIELLFAVGIVALLALGASATFSMLSTQHLNNTTEQLMHFVQTARQLAMSHRKPTIICPTSTHTRCAKRWAANAIAFIDQDKDGTLSDGDHILVHYRPTSQSISIDWRAFGRRATIAFTHEGYTAHQNGRFYLCMRNGDKAEERQILLHKSGRTRRAAPTEFRKSSCT